MQLNARKNLYYYLIYLLIYLLLYISIYSTISFFHFLLDHDMATIESWISRNNWEVVGGAKFVALFVCLKFISLNQYAPVKFGESIREQLQWPSLSAWMLSLFLLGVTIVLSKMYYIPAKIPVVSEQVLISSFLGVIFFFGLDILFLFLLGTVFPPESTSQKNLFITLTILFAVATKLSIPYLGAYLTVAILHFVSMYFFCLKNRISDAIIYSLLIVAPLNTFLYLNLFTSWGEVGSYQLKFFFGIIFLWLIGLVYYKYSKLN